MKITKIDKMILELLRKTPEGMDTIKIAIELNKDVSYINKRLNRMYNYKVLDKINSKPVFYKINRRKNSQLILKKIECPFCKKISIIDFHQNTKLCKKCNKRYYIYKNRIIDIIYI